MSGELDRADVVIIGAGPAGLAAGLFTARYGLRTRIVAGGPSRLRQCAYLDNYLGFPGGIDPGEFLRLARSQALEAGCVLTTGRVVSLTCEADRWLVHTRSAAFPAARVIAAAGYERDFLRELSALGLFDERDELRVDACGRTPCRGLYATGPLAGVEDQALICAGHGARVALALLQDLRSERFRWSALARHLDWQVREGVYDSARWAERVYAYFEGECQPSAAGEPSFRALVDAWIDQKRGQQIARSELARRAARLEWTPAADARSTGTR